MLVVALVMAVIGLAALVTAVVTSNQVIAWVCIGASVIGVVLLIVDALRERRQRETKPGYDADYPEDEEPQDVDQADVKVGEKAGEHVAETPDEEAPATEETTGASEETK